MQKVNPPNVETLLVVRRWPVLSQHVLKLRTLKHKDNLNYSKYYDMHIYNIAVVFVCFGFLL
jgi:hypothetical protein